MKRTSVLRTVAFLLAILLLGGCAKAPRMAVVSRNDASTEETTAPDVTAPAQEDMPAEKLEKAVLDIDMSVLCAGFDLNQRTKALEEPYGLLEPQIIYADYNRDGYREVLMGRTNHLTFRLSPQRSVDYTFAQSAPDYYTDNDGNLYQFNGLGDGFSIEVDGQPAWIDHMNYWYQRWENGAWETVYDYKGTITYLYTDDNREEEIENTVIATIEGTQCTKAELDTHLESIGMRMIASRPSQYVQNQYDAVYRDSLLNRLDTYLAENYSGYTQINADIDYDGAKEAVFILPDFEDVWYNSLRTVDEYNSIEDAQHWFRSEFSDQRNHTGILIADVQGEKLTVTAHCASQYFSVYEGMRIQIENGLLWLDNTCVYLNGRFANVDSANVPSELIAYMADFGYSDHFFRKVDVTDMEGDEYMCICAKDGSWYIFIIVFVDGNPAIVYSSSLSQTAVYLTEHQGKQCLLTYYQSMWQQGDTTISNYNYSIIRIDGNGQQQMLEDAYCEYTDKDEDATAVSAFFEKLNVYLIKIIVIRDPYQLTGKLWMDQADAEHGTVPQEENQPQQPEQDSQEPVMGFVQIEDPSSWLNLRVGPGVEYDKVLLDESDPNSFVRQALGSPVTVLETIETGDPENPVWLKIRIQYADREIIGYSSKTYIRLVNE